jgi:hydrogenase maturation factor
MCLGIPGRIFSVIDSAFGLAMVEVGGVRRAIGWSTQDLPARMLPRSIAS